MPTSYKSSIDIALSGTQGLDWDVEDLFFDPVVFDSKVIYLKQGTEITLSHNSRNVSYAGSGVYEPVVEPNVGTILYKIDRDMNWGKMWGDAGDNRTFYTFAGGTQSIAESNNATYSAPFALEDLTYDGSTAVVGATGATGTVTNWGTYYWRGIEDSVGDEWHVLTVADYDSFITAGEGKASDGKVFLLVVNPKTPILKVAATGDAQFYTTPAKVYFVPKIHDQTTYIAAGTGGVTITLKDINGKNVHYRINGGDWVDAGASSIVLDQDDFSTGSNTLEYYYAGNEEYTKTRTVVKDPAFPSTGETHGLLLYGTEARKTESHARIARVPYKSTFDSYCIANNTLKNPLTNFDSDYRSGKRICYGKFALLNAFAADVRGYDTTPTGKTTTSAQYAKRMLLDSERNIDPVGFELNHSGRAIPTRELFYRGYYDMDCTFSLAFTYDLLIANYKSTQVTGGITPVEDHFIRDRLAGCAFDAMMAEGNWTMQSYTNTGMWNTARNVGGLFTALAMPGYATPYYGTCGVDGTTTTYAWTPFPDTPLTWKKVFIQNDATLVGYPNLNYRFGVEEYQFDADGNFDDRISYLGMPLMGHIFQLLSDITKANSVNAEGYPRLSLAFGKMADNTIVGLKAPEEEYSDPFACLLLVNPLHPGTAGVFNSAGKTNPSGSESEPYEIYRVNPYSFVYYEDDYVGLDAPSSLTAIATGSSAIALSWTDNASDETGYVVERSLNGTTGWTEIATLAADTESYTDSGLLGSTAYHYRVKAYNAYGSSAYSDVATDTTDAAPSLIAGIAIGQNAMTFL